MLMDPHPRQQHAGLHLPVWLLQQEVTRPWAKFKSTSPEKSRRMGEQSAANISRSVRCTVLDVILCTIFIVDWLLYVEIMRSDWLTLVSWLATSEYSHNFTLKISDWDWLQNDTLKSQFWSMSYVDCFTIQPSNF